MSRVVACRSCGKPMIFLTTRNGLQNPVDADTVQDGDRDFDPKRHKSHFATCPNARMHRKGARHDATAKT